MKMQKKQNIPETIDDEIICQPFAAINLFLLNLRHN